MENDFKYLPKDWENPDFSNIESKYDWKNFVTLELQIHWQNMTDLTKKCVANNFGYIKDTFWLT